MPDASLIGERHQGRYLVVNGEIVQTDAERERMEAHLREVAERRPELVRPAKTEQQRNELTAQRFTRTRQRGTTRAARPSRRPVRRAQRTTRTADSRGDPREPDPPRGGPHRLARRL